MTTVLDKVENGITTLILDASAACHMPDVLEMPYTPPLRGGLKISDMEDEYGIDKDIEIDFDMDVKRRYMETGEEWKIQIQTVILYMSCRRYHRRLSIRQGKSMSGTDSYLKIWLYIQWLRTTHLTESRCRIL